MGIMAPGKKSCSGSDGREEDGVVVLDGNGRGGCWEDSDGRREKDDEASKDGSCIAPLLVKVASALIILVVGWRRSIAWRMDDGTMLMQVLVVSAERAPAAPATDLLKLRIRFKGALIMGKNEGTTSLCDSFSSAISCTCHGPKSKRRSSL